MPSPFAYLGLADDADERAVKRAYAQRLKNARPDVDPAGFQELHEAYQAALSRTRRREQPADVEEEEEEEAAAIEPARARNAATQIDVAIPAARIVLDDADERTAEPRPPDVLLRFEDRPAPPGEAHPAAPIFDLQSALPAVASSDRDTRFEFEAFHVALIALVRTKNATAMTAWLSSLPALWSLRNKASAGHALVERLEVDRPPLSAEHFDALAVFFDLDDVSVPERALALQQLRRRLHGLWIFAGENDAVGSERIRQHYSNVFMGPKRLSRALARLRSRRPMWRDYLDAAVPGLPAQMRGLIGTLFGMPPRELPDSIDPQEIRFWLRASDPTRLSAPRLVAALLQALGLAIGLQCLGILLITHDARRETDFAGDLRNVALAAGALRVAVVFLQLLMHWQNKPERPGEILRWLRWSFLPLLCAACWGALALDARGIAMIFAFFATLFALLRWRARSPRGPLTWSQVGISQIYFGTIFLGLSGVPEFAMAIPTTLWIADVVRYIVARRKSKA